MDNSVMTDLSIPNYATNILYGLVFQQGSLPALKGAGLLGVYIDDYGCKKKYQGCLFFHFRHYLDNLLFQKSHGIQTMPLLNSITSFKSFYDFYETPEGIMFVFKYNPEFYKDLSSFRRGRFSQFGPTFKELAYSRPLQDSGVDLSKEIYRYV